MRLGHELPLLHLPANWPHGADGTITLQALDIPLYQPTVPGTPAHFAAYISRRQTVESVFSSLKTDIGRIGESGTCKVFGRIKKTLFLAFRCAAHNRDRVRTFEREQAEAAAEGTPKSRGKRRKRTLDNLPRSPGLTLPTTAIESSTHDPPPAR
jgi:hypothetical protein